MYMYIYIHNIHTQDGFFLREITIRVALLTLAKRPHLFLFLLSSVRHIIPIRDSKSRRSFVFLTRLLSAPHSNPVALTTSGLRKQHRRRAVKCQ